MNHLDLFSGIGGFSIASHWAGFRTVAFVEIDPFCQKVLAKNFPGVLGEVLPRRVSSGMHPGVTCLAQRLSVIDIEPAVGVGRPRLDVMTPEVVAGGVAASLAGVAITEEDHPAPATDLGLVVSRMSLGAVATLPERMFVSPDLLPAAEIGAIGAAHRSVPTGARAKTSLRPTRWQHHLGAARLARLRHLRPSVGLGCFLGVLSGRATVGFRDHEAIIARFDVLGNNP